jgi:hypothetical protein
MTTFILVLQVVQLKKPLQQALHLLWWFQSMQHKKNQDNELCHNLTSYNFCKNQDDESHLSS